MLAVSVVIAVTAGATDGAGTASSAGTIHNDHEKNDGYEEGVPELISTSRVRGGDLT